MYRYARPEPDPTPKDVPGSVALGFRGDGRVVRLTQRTVRPAFFRFVEENHLTGYHLRPLERPTGPRLVGYRTPIIDILFRRYRYADYLSLPEVAAVERFINSELLTNGRCLVTGEGVIRGGTVAAPGTGRTLRPTHYLLRCGLALELRQLAVPDLVAGDARDAVVEDHERQLRVVRFLGRHLDRRDPGIVLRFADRFDLAVTWDVRAAAFRPRRVFAVRRVAACHGFHLDGLHVPDSLSLPTRR